MELNEVKIGDTVSFTHKGKKITGKVIHRHDGTKNAALSGHINVQPLEADSRPHTIHVSKIKPAKQIKEDIQMSDINEAILDLIDSIEAGNHMEANSIFSDLLQDKIAALLDAKKVEVSSSMFNTEECADCMEEEKKMKKNEEEDEEDEDEELDEALKGKQHKIDANKNGKLDAHDFKLLRAKKGVKEENELEEGIKDTVKKYAKKTMHTAAEVGDALVQGAVHGLSHGASNPAPMSTYSHIKPFKKLANKVAKEEVELEEGNAENKAKKNAFVSKVGSQVSKFRERTDKTSGRAAMRPQPHNSKIDSRDYQKSGKDAFWKKKGIGTGVHKEEVEQVDEIKKSTLQNYVSKAVVNMSASNFKGDSKKVAKRVKGIGAATQKMKEEVEQTQEAYSDPYAAKKAAEMKKSYNKTMADAKKEFESSKESKGKKMAKNFMKMKESNEVLGEEEYDYYRDYKAGGASYDDYKTATRNFQSRQKKLYTKKPAEVKEPHSVHINGKKWKSFSSHGHASNVAKKLSAKGGSKKFTVHKD
jgi:hypothetical protein